MEQAGSCTDAEGNIEVWQGSEIKVKVGIQVQIKAFQHPACPNYQRAGRRPKPVINIF